MKLSSMFALLFAVTISGMSFANTLDLESHFGGHHGGMYNKKVVCTAVNKRGHEFRARGQAFRRHEVQRRAVEKCYEAGSAVCRPTGCHRF